MNKDVLRGACFYLLFLLIAAHPFINIHISTPKMDAQEITNWLTATMAVTTVWLGIETRKMALAAKASINLETTPYLSFRGFDIKIGDYHDISNQNTAAFRLALRLSNPGKVLVTYQVEKMSVSINQEKISDAKLPVATYVIHPTEEMLFLFPLITSREKVRIPTAVEVEYRILYWSIPNAKQRLSAKINLTLTSEASHDWNYVEGPIYTSI